VLKIFSTPDDPGKAVLDGLRRVVANLEVVVRHGTTVGANAMLERKGGRVAFLTTEAFEDKIAIRRQASPSSTIGSSPRPIASPSAPSIAVGTTRGNEQPPNQSPKANEQKNKKGSTAITADFCPL
jgi:N-methylhydantoinase A/oxoprolinase/acetone carboxylase beta subunit